MADSLTCEYPPIGSSAGPDVCNPAFAGQLNLAKNLGGPDADCAACVDAAANADDADPINFMTGSLFLIERDYTGAGADPLLMRRYYNSMDSGSAGYGPGWRGSYSRALIVNSPTSVTLVRDDARQLVFTLSNGVWQGDADVNGRLAATPAGGHAAAWTYTTARDEVETYAVNGRLESVRTRSGLTTTFGYDAAGRLGALTDAFGRAVLIAWNAAGTIAAITGPDGSAWSFAYDSAGRLATATDPAGGQRQYVYDNSAFPNLLTGIVDEDGNRFLTVGYDADGRAISAQRAGGVASWSIDNTFLATKGVVTVTNPGAVATSYMLQAINGTASWAQNAFACWSCFSPYAVATDTYDANGNRIAAQDYDSYTTSATFDTARNLETSRSFVDGEVVNTTWHPTFRLPTRISDPVHTYTYGYDAWGNLTSRAVAAADGSAAATWRWAYNGAGEPAYASDPDGDTTAYGYDAMGNLASVTNALGQKVSLTSYDANGRPLTMIDANGVQTTLTYNFRGQILSATRGGQASTFAYDPAGNMAARTTPDGATTTYAYDAAHRLSTITDAIGNRIALTRDGLGNVTEKDVYAADGTLTWTHKWQWDGFSRLIGENGAQGQSTLIWRDPIGVILIAYDQNGNMATYNYDSRYRPTDIHVGGISTVYTYDLAGRIASVTDNRRLATTYTYTPLDRPATITSADVGTTTLTYSAAGDLTGMLDARGQTVTYGRDALHRLSAMTTSDGQNFTFTYDTGTNAIGHMTGLTEPAGTTSWTYTADGRIARRRWTAPAQTLIDSFTYDATTGRMLTHSYPSGKAIAYRYDADGRVNWLGYRRAGGTTTDPLITDITYQPFGPVAAWGVPNGQTAMFMLPPFTVTRAFDQDGQMSSIKAPYVVWTGTQLARPSVYFGHDALGNVTFVGQSFYPAMSLYYDSRNRLYQVNAGTSYQTYSYDRWSDNRVGLSSFDGSTLRQTSYTYDTASNHLQSLSGALLDTFGWDAAGNMTQHTFAGGAYNFTYDSRGRMRGVSVVANGSVTGTYTYTVNAFGQRAIKAKAGTDPTQFVYDANGMIAGRYNPTIGSEETVYLGTLPVALMMPKATYWITPDHTGAPLAITDGNGNPFWTWHRDAFGNGVPWAPLSTYRERLAGQHSDAEAGLSANGLREYDPALGRFVEPDPIGPAGGANPYVYAANNPERYTDRLGLCWQGDLACTLAARAAQLPGYWTHDHPAVTDVADIALPGPDLTRAGFAPPDAAADPAPANGAPDAVLPPEVPPALDIAARVAAVEAGPLAMDRAVALASCPRLCGAVGGAEVRAGENAFPRLADAIFGGDSDAAGAP